MNARFFLIPLQSLMNLLKTKRLIFSYWLKVILFSIKSISHKSTYNTFGGSLTYFFTKLLSFLNKNSFLSILYNISLACYYRVKNDNKRFEAPNSKHKGKIGKGCVNRGKRRVPFVIMFRSPFRFLRQRK